MQFMLNLMNLFRSSIAMGAKLCAVFLVPSREVREAKDAVCIMQPKGKLGCQPSPSYLHSFKGGKKKKTSFLCCSICIWRMGPTLGIQCKVTLVGMVRF